MQFIVLFFVFQCIPEYFNVFHMKNKKKMLEVQPSYNFFFLFFFFFHFYIEQYPNTKF